MDAIFDARGYRVAWLDAPSNVVRDPHGRALAWLTGTAAFAKHGRMICWHQDGVFYLRDGVVASLADTLHGPLKPRLRQPGPPPTPHAVPPPRRFQTVTAAPPVPDRWSSVTWPDLLEGRY